MRKRKADANDLLIILAGICLVLAGICRFILPGVRFSAQLFFGVSLAAVGFLVLNRWARNSAAVRRFRNLCVCLLSAGMLVFVAVEIVILWTGEQPAPEDQPVEAVIVLGAGVNGTTPSLTLRTRLNAAGEYLLAHPDVPAVLSGGQGPGEDITEAFAMYQALVTQGIAPERLLLEEASTSTSENLAYSLELLQVAGVSVDGTIGIVTNDFHQFRTRLIANDMGMSVVGIPAELPWWLNANYYVREFFALGKLCALKLFE